MLEFRSELVCGQTNRLTCENVGAAVLVRAKEMRPADGSTEKLDVLRRGAA